MNRNSLSRLMALLMFCLAVIFTQSSARAATQHFAHEADAAPAVHLEHMEEHADVSEDMHAAASSSQHVDRAEHVDETAHLNHLNLTEHTSDEIAHMGYHAETAEHSTEMAHLSQHLHEAEDHCHEA